MDKDTRSKHKVTEVAKLFFRLGVTAFGGPAAHIAMMHDEVVKRHQWLSDDEFLDLIGATNLIPGMSFVLLIRFKVNSTWLIAGGAAFGLLMAALQ